MVKRQKEKQYQSAREHRANQALRTGGARGESAGARPLPFDCCALTLMPYQSPVCTVDGIIFDNSAITQHLLKHKTDPVSGNKLATRDLITLNMDKTEEGQWQCPVLNKPFTNRTKVVAIRQRPPGNEANVYSYEAFNELNIKARNYLDLTTGLKFSKDDVIVLNDPDDKDLLRMRDIQNFFHTKAMREENDRKQSTAAGAQANVKYNLTADRILQKLDKEKRKRERASEEQAKKLLKTEEDEDVSAKKGGYSAKDLKIYADELISAKHMTSGKASGSLTSTAMDIQRENTARLATEDEIVDSQVEQLRRLKKKGMVRMYTNRGNMDISVHCDIVPRTALNFMLLAHQGEYDGSKFHRSIRNFMVQGGKKPGSKDGGSSIWGKPFRDEFDDRLKHSGKGVVSMANSGPKTNQRQFFITYNSCSHLDRKHSVFGKIVGGLDILRRISEIPTDKDTDKPLETIKIERMELLDDPVSEALELERRRIEERKNEKRKEAASRQAGALGGRAGKSVTKGEEAQSKAVEEDKPSVGKYLSKKKKKKKSSEIAVNRLPPPPKKTSFGDFSGW